MASKEKRKLQKRKERDEKNKKSRLHRQAVATAKRQEEAAEFRKNQRIRKLQREMGELSVWADDVLMKMDDKVLTQLEHNAKILKALEQDYEKEKNKKEELNKELEDKGLKTLKDKMKFLHDKLVADQQEAGEAVLAEDGLLNSKKLSALGPAGSAECSFSPNKPEVAEVSVTKAPIDEEEKTEEA